MREVTEVSREGAGEVSRVTSGEVTAGEGQPWTLPWTQPWTFPTRPSAPTPFSAAARTGLLLGSRRAPLFPMGRPHAAAPS